MKRLFLVIVLIVSCFCFIGSSLSASGDPVVEGKATTPTNTTFDAGGTGNVFSLEDGTDPDVSATTNLTLDTDGANETSDVVLRGWDGTNQFAVGRKLDCIHVTVVKPNDFADATRDKAMIWSNETGMTFTITKIEAWSDVTATAFVIDEFDADGSGNTHEVDGDLNCATGSGPYTDTETDIALPVIEASHTLFIDFDDTDDPGWVKITICGWYNADVD